VSDADQTPLDLDFFQSAEHKSAEAHIVFEVAKDGFGFNTALLAQGHALLGEEVVSGLLAIALQFEAEFMRRLPLALVHRGLSGQVVQFRHS